MSKPSRKQSALCYELSVSKSPIQEVPSLKTIDSVVTALEAGELGTAIDGLCKLFKHDFWWSILDRPLQRTELQMIQLVKHACSREKKRERRYRLMALAECLLCLDRSHILHTINWLLIKQDYPELIILLLAFNKIESKEFAEVTESQKSRKTTELLLENNQSQTADVFLDRLLAQSMITPFFDERCKEAIKEADYLNTLNVPSTGVWDLNKIIYQSRGQVCLVALMVFDRLGGYRPSLLHLVSALEVCNDFAIYWLLIAIRCSRQEKIQAIINCSQDHVNYLVVAQGLVTTMQLEGEAWNGLIECDHRFLSNYVTFISTSKAPTDAEESVLDVVLDNGTRFQTTVDLRMDKHGVVRVADTLKTVIR